MWVRASARTPYGEDSRPTHNCICLGQLKAPAKRGFGRNRASGNRHCGRSIALDPMPVTAARMQLVR